MHDKESTNYGKLHRLNMKKGHRTSWIIEEKRRDKVREENTTDEEKGKGN